MQPNAAWVGRGARIVGAPTLFLVAGGTASITDAGAIPSAEAFGTPAFSAGGIAAISDAGAIASAEAFGEPTFTATFAPGVVYITNTGGIASAEAFGIAQVHSDLASSSRPRPAISSPPSSLAAGAALSWCQTRPSAPRIPKSRW